MTQRALFTGHDGSVRLQVHPGEGEFVCAECDIIVVDNAPPALCTSCGCDRIETLTSVRPAGWTAEGANG